MLLRTIIPAIVCALVAVPALAAPPAGGHGKKAHAAHGAKAKKPLKPQKHCPIMGEVLEDEEVFLDIEGQRVYFCCPGCIDAFKKSPDKGFAKLAELGEVAESIQKSCPICKAPVDPKKSSHVMVRGRRVFYGCPGCDKEIVAKPDKALSILDKETKALAKKKAKTHKGGAHEGHGHH